MTTRRKTEPIKIQFARYVADRILTELISTAQVIQADMKEIDFTIANMDKYWDEQTDCGQYVLSLVLKNITLNMEAALEEGSDE